MADLRWDDLQLFLVMYRARSLTRAAAELGLNPSTTSRRLTGLEEAVGTQLFERTPQGLVPTEAALRIAPAAERAEIATHDALRSLEGLGEAPAGEVRVAVSDAMASWGIAPALARLRDRHPEIMPSLVVSNTLADLTRREADLAIRFVRPEQGDLVAKRVLDDDYALFAAPGGRTDALIGWDDANAHLREARWEAQSGLPIVARASTVNARIALAQAGVGAVALAQAFGRRLPGLSRVAGVEVPLRAEAWLVTHASLREVPRVRAVWRFLEELFAGFRA